MFIMYIHDGIQLCGENSGKLTLDQGQNDIMKRTHGQTALANN